jgi:glycosyltransferase involved in cell wall biosynthesis
VWDIDDDYGSLPDHSPPVLKYGRAATDEFYRSMLTTARLSTVTTTPSAMLAQRYRDAGVGRVAVVPNAVSGAVRPCRPHDGVVVGWIAASEHSSDVRWLNIPGFLRRLIEAHPEVQVECIGVGFPLPERYRHSSHVPFAELPSRMATWDIGIAPLANTPFNCARSDIKVKEYAASGVPWLASDLEPYAHLGPDYGGRLVADDQWFAELQRLVRDEPGRHALAERGRAWAATETTDVIAARWEQVYREAMAAVALSRAKPRRAKKQRARR